MYSFILKEFFVGVLSNITSIISLPYSDIPALYVTEEIHAVIFSYELIIISLFGFIPFIPK